MFRSAIEHSGSSSEILLQDIFNATLDVKISETDLSLTKHFSDVEDFKDAAKSNFGDLSDLELAKSLRLLLGESEEVIEQMPDEIILASLNYEEVIVQESYLKMDITGKVELISQQQLEKELNTIQRDNPSQLLLMSDCDVQAFNTINAEKKHTYTFPNGYMKITTRASRVAKHTNDETWLVSGEALWLKDTFWTLTDMLTIGSSALYDSDYSNLEYGCKSSYRSCISGAYGRINHDYNKTTYNTIKKEYTSGCGYSIKSSLLCQLCSAGSYSYGNSYHTVREDRSHRYFAQYCVNTTGNFNVLVAYGHRRLAVGGVSASISTSGSGSVGISFNVGTEAYISQPLLVKPSDY